jgi:hypothetical protein
LRKLGLTVGTKVLVSKAAHNLEIAIIPADHKQLFEDLRRLRERVKVSRLNPAGHKIISSAFRRRPRHERSFDLKEALFVERLPDSKSNLRAHDDVALHARAPQVHIAIFQPRVFLHINVIFEWKRWRTRCIEDPQLLGR